MSVRPLGGLRVAVTRDPAQAAGLVTALIEAGAEPVEIPLIEIQPAGDRGELDAALAQIDTYDWLIFTSANAVRHFAATAPSPLPQRLRVCTIGSASTEAALGAGWPVALTPARSNAEAVVAAVTATGSLAGQRVLFPASAGARDVVPLGLRVCGAVVDVVEAYRTVPSERGVAQLRQIFASSETMPAWITLTSPSTVKALLTAVSRERLDGVKLASIGPLTSAALRKHGLRVNAEAVEQSPQGLVRAMSLA